MEKKAWPYMAGIMDTDGSIYLISDKRKNGIIGYGLTVTVASIHRELIDWMIANFGGTFCKASNHRGYSKSSPSSIYYWRLFGKEKQEAFLVGILPYLKIKKEKARLAIEFLRLYGWNTEKRLELLNKCRDIISKEQDFETKDQKPKEISAYIAGVLDGDGSIYSKTIEVGSLEIFLMKWLLGNFGGRFYTKTLKSKKLFYIWRLSGRANKINFLLKIIPYLIIKREKARNLLTELRVSARDSATTETIDIFNEMKTQSDLIGDNKSLPMETSASINNIV